ncbi:MAG: RNA polymerase sigma factor [Actinomycetota bacterium]
MTSDQQRRFEAEWPALALRLQALLRRKRLTDWMIEDLVQETGCRLIRMWSQVDRTKPVWPLVTTIALNLLRDEMRKGSRNELTGAVPDSPSGENVEARGLARVELSQLGGALSQMNDSQRSVLLASVTESATEGADPSALRMLRMRARRRLHQLMDQASVLSVTVGFQLRRVMREAELFMSRALPLDAERVPAAVFGVAAALSVGLAALPVEVVDGSWGQRGPVVATSTGRSADATRPAGTDPTSPLGAAPEAPPSAHGMDRDKHSRDGEAAGGNGGHGLGDEGSVSRGATYHVPIAEGTYVAGTVTVELEGFDEQGDDTSSTGTGSLSCSSSPSGGAGVSCTHGGEGWDQRTARIKQHTEIWVEGERIY